jgi:hypothetical protein
LVVRLLRKMKTFKSFILEADPKRDLKVRQEANRVWTKIVRATKSKSLKAYRIPKDEYGGWKFEVVVGSLINDKTYDDLFLSFVAKDITRKGYYKPVGKKFHEIHLNTIPTMSAKRLHVFSKETREELLFQSLGVDTKNTFVHEFTHYKDALRYKDQDYKYKGTSQYSDSQKWQMYYNSPKEMNAFYQAAVNEVEKWYSGQYEDIVRRMDQSLKMPHQDFDVKWAEQNLNSIRRYIKDKKFAYDTAFNYITMNKRKGFYEYLTSENKKKMQARIYQYVDRILMPKMKKLEPKMKKVIDKFHVKNRKEHPEQYE